MFKGFLKGDADSAAIVLLGLAVGGAAGKAAKAKLGKHGAMIGAGLGTVAGLGARALLDPQLKAERV